MNRSALLWTVIPAAVVVYLLIRFATLPWTALRILGLIFTLVGLILVAIARYQLGHSFTIVPEARALVTTGLYSKIRNPVYIFGSIAGAGLLLYLNRPDVFWIFLILIPAQFIRARAEARVLEAKFGDAYRQYKSRTWL